MYVRAWTVYVVVGQYFEHLYLLLSLYEKGLLDSGDYFVVGVDVEQFDPDNDYFGGNYCVCQPEIDGCCSQVC